VARPKEFDPDKALMRAIGLFANYGYEGASTEALLEVMGVSRQSLYDTFGSKRDLYIEAVRRYNFDSVAKFVRNLEEGVTPLHGLRRALISHISRRDGFTNGACLGVGSICEFGRRDPAILAASSEAAPQLLEPLVKTLIRAQAIGEIRAGVDPQLAAELLLTTLNGLKVNARAGMPVKRQIEIGSLALEAFTIARKKRGTALEK
jgi:TetR/AcrR family transcriptional regulator, transcriptional repressor for nem operon